MRVIPAKIANDFIRRNHYSGKVVQNSKLHFGVFTGGLLHGVLSYGSPLDKSKVLGLVKNADGSPTAWGGMLELNRMAFDAFLPKNSESRAIAITIRLIRKRAPHIKWILSFADGTQCGDGTIYRASGFALTAIRTNKNTVRLPDGSVIHKMTLESNPNQKRPELGGRSYYDLTGGRYDFAKYVSAVQGGVLVGYQLRYIYLVDKTCVLNCPRLPYSDIDKLGAGMYRGKRVPVASRRSQMPEGQ